MVGLSTRGAEGIVARELGVVYVRGTIGSRRLLWPVVAQGGDEAPSSSLMALASCGAFNPDNGAPSIRRQK
jgi:hypothetical protein